MQYTYRFCMLAWLTSCLIPQCNEVQQAILRIKPWHTGTTASCMHLDPNTCVTPNTLFFHCPHHSAALQFIGCPSISDVRV